jgi:hypothetical protein
MSFVASGAVSTSLLSRAAPRPNSAAFRKDPFRRRVFCCTTAAMARLAFLGDVLSSPGMYSGLGGPSAGVWFSSALARRKDSLESSPPELLLLWPPTAPAPSLWLLVWCSPWSPGGDSKSISHSYAPWTRLYHRSRERPIRIPASDVEFLELVCGAC